MVFPLSYTPAWGQEKKYAKEKEVKMEYLIIVILALIAFYGAEALNYWSDRREDNVTKPFFDRLREWEDKNLPK